MSHERGKPCLHSFWSVPVLEEDLWDSHHRQTGLSVSEDGGHVYVEADLPGLKPEEIDISCEKGVLWIRGEKEEEEIDKKKKFYRKTSGSFSYRVHVPGQINEKEEPEASYENGVVRVVFRKAKEMQAKKIKIVKK